MALPTRLQQRSRPTKRPMWKGSYATDTGVITLETIPARTPRFDMKGYPAYKGLPGPVLCRVTETVGGINRGGGGSQSMTWGDDPADFTVSQVQAFCLSIWPDRDGPAPSQAEEDEVQRIVDAERAGRNRTSLITWLDHYQGIV